MKLPCLLFFALSCVFAGGCEQSPAGLAVVGMKIGNQTFRLEVAATSASQETGLMKRDSMPADHGMIFVFAEEAMRDFWMKNTRIPLDILFVSSNGTIVSIHQMAPYDEQLTSSDFPARYAIELNLGAAREAGAKVGDHLIIPAEAKPK